jgi:hypothetical protein
MGIRAKMPAKTKIFAKNTVIVIVEMATLIAISTFY